MPEGRGRKLSRTRRTYQCPNFLLLLYVHSSRIRRITRSSRHTIILVPHAVVDCCHLSLLVIITRSLPIDALLAL